MTAFQQYQQLTLELFAKRQTAPLSIEEEAERASDLCDLWYQLSGDEQSELEDWIEEQKTIFAAVEIRLSELQQLRSNWDSYGGATPSHEAIFAASRLLTMIVAQTGVEDSRLDTLHVGPTSTGGVHVEWDVNDRTLEASIASNGSVSWTRIWPDDEETEYAGMSAEVTRSCLAWLLQS